MKFIRFYLAGTFFLPRLTVFHIACRFFRVRGKTIFTLCYTCALLEQQEECQHRDPRKRGLIGIYSSPEILYALTVGYNIIQVLPPSPPPFHRLVGIFLGFSNLDLERRERRTSFIRRIYESTRTGFQKKNTSWFFFRF